MSVSDERRLPELLRLADGEVVDDARTWETRRRPELLEALAANVYGRVPVGAPLALEFARWSEPSDVPGAALLAASVAYRGPGGEGAIRVQLYLPSEATGDGRSGNVGAVPVLVLGSHRAQDATLPAKGDGGDRVNGFWPVTEITRAGFATAAFHFADVDPDAHDGFRDGVHGIFDRGARRADSWGTIAAWAWGFSRVADLLATLPEVDARRVGIVGHSRGGKAALWAAAQDARFALVMANGSGSTGAALARGKSGERVADIVARFPHWFCGRYADYAGREEALPVDQHMLLALIAPRLLYLGNAEEDAWADPESERAALAAAAPAWELYGTGGRLGYHLRPGGHDLTLKDWRRLLAFAAAAWL